MNHEKQQAQHQKNNVNKEVHAAIGPALQRGAGAGTVAVDTAAPATALPFQRGSAKVARSSAPPASPPPSAGATMAVDDDEIARLRAQYRDATPFAGQARIVPPLPVTMSRPSMSMPAT